MKISQSVFGEINGVKVDLFTLSNDNNITVKITNYGGTITSITAPDKFGTIEDIVCGFNSFDEYFSAEYKANSPYFGCLVGRYAARIKDGRFNIDDNEYSVATNDGPNHLHGGVVGFDKQVWSAEPFKTLGSVGVMLKLHSPDMQEGYPGNLDVEVTYTLNNDNEISIDYKATTDKQTPLSLTNHTYFNLGGFKDKITDHTARIDADSYLVPDSSNVPLGERAQVANTAEDFTSPKPIGDAFDSLVNGFEHYYIFNKPEKELAKVAEFCHEESGRRLEISTTEPGMLFYTGYYTSDMLKRDDETRFGQFKAFCCETSKYPNGPNIEGSPRSILNPGEVYRETTIFKLGKAI